MVDQDPLGNRDPQDPQELGLGAIAMDTVSLNRKKG